MEKRAMSPFLQAGPLTSRPALNIDADVDARTDALLLTGATGFVGMALLARILERTNRHVVVLVRAASQSEADARLATLMSSVVDSPERYRGRVTAVRGDLTAPGLGLGTRRDGIAEQVGEIIHGAASVSFNLSLSRSRSINVEGTRRLLGLARDCARAGNGLRRMTYVSTAYVAGERHGYAHESELDVGQSFRNAYEQSKQESERLVCTMQEQLPLTIVRPSIVVGERDTGWTSSFNVMYGPMRAVAAGALPVMPGRDDGVLDVVTVDYVADAILALAASPSARGGTFQIVSGKEATTVGELSRLAARRFRQRQPRLIPPRVYRSVLHPLMLCRADQARRRRLRASEVYFPYMSLDLRFDDRRARELLEPVGLRATPINECFDTLMDFAEAAKWGRAPISRVETLRPTRAAVRQAPPSGAAGYVSPHTAEAVA
jgi:thioester reductase-like protein